MSDAVDRLLETLDLDREDDLIWIGHTPSVGWRRVYGGQVIAQALVAAGRTVEDRHAHSLHAYFILPGDPEIPIRYEVDPIRDGRSFTTRRVVAWQKDAAIFVMSASFHRKEPGYDHQMPMPDVPDPDDLPGESELLTTFLETLPDNMRVYFSRGRPIELRPVDMARWAGPRARGKPGPLQQYMWFRATGPVPDNEKLEQAVLAYASDTTLIEAALLAHGQSVFDADMQVASLDHVIWFHRPVRTSDWLLYAQDSPTAIGGRGLARGLIYDRQGRLVASVAQEGLMRPKNEAK
ncbi:MAG: acyl-CoA thioesterase II [Pseudomonadota bacterium]